MSDFNPLVKYIAKALGVVSICAGLAALGLLAYAIHEVLKIGIFI